ncbi:Lar family restriction alleviation protein [Methanomassiliicoccales archaeon LGM-RCC1]|nr:Lar family restriction alleviation protein [Methanomassiliicoccales archaeon LGM-RCC1]
MNSANKGKWGDPWPTTYTGTTSDGIHHPTVVKLKPCPFCGAPAKIMKGCGEDWVQCVNPKCSCCSSMHTNTQMAIEIWNRRARE